MPDRRASAARLDVQRLVSTRLVAMSACSDGVRQVICRKLERLLDGMRQVVAEMGALLSPWIGMA